MSATVRPISVSGGGSDTAINITDRGVSPSNSGAANFTATQTLLTELQLTGGRVLIPAGVYAYAGATDLTYNSSKDLSISWDPLAEWDFAASTANVALNIAGTLIASFALTVDANVDAHTVTVPGSVASVIVGDGRDVLKFIPGTGMGELAEVRSGSGVTATLQSSLLDSYVVGCTVEYYRMPRITLLNPTLTRNTAQANTALGLRYCRRVTIEGGYIRRARYIGVWGYNCVEFTAYNVEVDNAGSTGGEATNYGFGLGPGQKFLLDNCKVYSAKHALAASGNEPAWIVEARSCMFDSERVDATTIAVRSHATTQHLKMIDCDVRCGLSHAGRNLTVRGGRYRGKASISMDAIAITPQNAAIDFIHISGCHISDGAFGLIFFPQAVSPTINRFTVENVTSAKKWRFTAVTPFTATINDLAFVNNHIEAPELPLEITDGTGAVVIGRLYISGTYRNTVGGSGRTIILATPPTLRREPDARLITGTTFPQTILESDVTNLTTDLAGKMTKVSGRQETLDNRGTTSGTVTLNLGTGNYFTVTANGNVTFAFGQIPASPIVATIQIEMTQDATGSRTWTFPASVKWDGGIAPVWSTVGGRKDLATLSTHDAGATWLGSARINYA